MKKKLECGDLIVVDPEDNPILVMVIKKSFDSREYFLCFAITENNIIPAGDMDWWNLNRNGRWIPFTKKAMGFLESTRVRNK